MKILLLSFEYPEETGFGGIGTYTWYQARALAKLGHEVHVLAGATTPTALRSEQHDGVTVFRFRSDEWLARCVAPMSRLRLWWSQNRLETALSMYRGLSRLQREFRYDIVEMPECGAEGLLVNHLSRLTTVVRFHSPAQLIMDYYDVRAMDRRLCSALEWQGIRAAGAYTSCSRFLATEVRAVMGVKRPIEVIPNGIDLDLFDAVDQLDFRREYDIPADRPMILFSGRLERRKGIELCREIASSILSRHEVAFVLIGQDLFNYATEVLLPHVNAVPRRGSIHVLGRVGPVAVRSAVRQCDIFLSPSLWENFPYACLEAMAAGRAIVCSDQGGMPEMIGHTRDGLLARTGDATSFIAQVEALLEDEAMRVRLGRSARARVAQSFTDTEVARRSTAFYGELLQRRGA